nr:hypothetical protein [Tanacetum cinerariifolium]
MLDLWLLFFSLEIVFYVHGMKNMILHTKNSFLSLLFIASEKELIRHLFGIKCSKYLQHEHYALWKVIEFGDSYKAPPEETVKDKGLAGEVSSSTKKKGRTVAIIAEDMQKRKNDEVILKNFGGNEATKKTKKNPLKQQYGNFKAEGSETLEQNFNRLQAIRNRDDLDTMSLDDVHNHLKFYEPEVQKRAGSNSQNMAFISSSNNSSGKSEVPTVQGASTASAQVPIVSTNVAAATLSYDTVCAFIAT